MRRQVERYAAYMRERGVDVTLWRSHSDPPGRYDVGHVFELDWPVEVARHTAAARRHCDRVVLSPVHHREAWIAEMNRAPRPGVTSLLRRHVSVERFESMRGMALAARAPQELPEATRQLLRGVRGRQLEVLAAADLVLTMARGEEESLAIDFDFHGRMGHIPHDVTEQATGPPPRGIPDEFVLCVGRVEARKNQLALLQAAQALDLPIVMVGPPNPRHRALIRTVEELVQSSLAITWLKEPSREHVLALFAAAACHVLPSWCEIVAQVDLEAAVAGTRVVTTTRGHMNEYLGDDAVYWDPPSGPERLAASIAAALDRPAPAPAPDRFPMGAVGEALLRAYELVLAG
jgi:glycosyltransferase involved in cell wall biosynthesis